ncbi:glycosyltransferase family 4 protein [Acetobacteraceae bacterium]|nr:glycosyltransferase family 4 protein [Acetobacteraceae bacterium]
MANKHFKNPIIVQLLPSLQEGGGIARGALEISYALLESGAQPIIISRGFLSKADRERGIIHISFNAQKTFSLLRLLWQVRGLKKILIDNGVDLVHARSRHPAWLAFLACRKLQIPWVTTWHGRHEAKYLSPRYFYNKGLLKGEKVIAVSQAIAQRILSEYKIPSERLEVITRGADSGYFNAGAISFAHRGKLAKAWHLKQNDALILVPSRLSRWKGQDVLLRALAELNKVNAKWQCIFVGEPTSLHYERELLEMIVSLGLEAQVSLKGFCPEMAVAYAMADFVVLPNIAPEPFGRTAIEAQMSGCPVVASACGGYLETLGGSPTATLVPPGDVEALAKAILAELEIPFSLREKRAKKSRDYCKHFFSLSVNLQSTLSIYDGLLGTSLKDAFAQTIR